MIFGLPGLEPFGGLFGNFVEGRGAGLPSRLGFGSGSALRGFILLTHFVTTTHPLTCGRRTNVTGRGDYRGDGKTVNQSTAPSGANGSYDHRSKRE